METPTDIDSEDEGKTPVEPAAEHDQPKSLSRRVVISVWLMGGLGLLVFGLGLGLGLPDIQAAFGRIWPDGPVTYFGLALRGTTGISLVLLGVLVKAAVDDQRLGSKRFLAGAIISLGSWAVLGGLWLAVSFLSAFGDNPQNGFEQELIEPTKAAVAVLLILGIVLAPSAIGFFLDRRSRILTSSLQPPAST